MPSINITWHNLHDGHKICPICQQLDNHTWNIEAGQGRITDVLQHPNFGPVWIVKEGSNVHSQFHMRGACRCYLTSEIDMSDILVKLRHLRDKILQGVGHA